MRLGEAEPAGHPGDCLALPTRSGRSGVFQMRSTAGLVNIVVMAPLLGACGARAVRQGDHDRNLRQAGQGVGAGAPAFKGETHPFKLIGAVIGAGGVAKLDVAGDVYRLADISQFSAPTSRGPGAIGLEICSNGDLALRNKAGVVMRLTAAQTGVTPSLGEDGIIIELGKA
jgi:hypothetical protein